MEFVDRKVNYISILLYIRTLIQHPTKAKKRLILKLESSSLEHINQTNISFNIFLSFFFYSLFSTYFVSRASSIHTVTPLESYD